MGKCLQIYYNEERDGKIREMIQELKERKNSPYYQRRSDSEIALMILRKALKSEVKKFQESNAE